MWAALALLMMVLAGCGGQTGPAAPTRPVPTDIPEPTPLPPLPTVPALGSELNPLVVLLAPGEGGDASGVESLGTAFTTDAGLYVEVRTAESYGDAYRALCEQRAAVVTLDAFTYLAASREGCGTARYVVERDGATATQGQFVARDVFQPQSYRGVFCRPDGESLHGWVIPTLTLRSRGVDPFTDLFDIVDAGSDEDVIRMIDAGECGLGATTLGAQNGVGDLQFPQRLRVLEELIPISNDVVVISSHLDEVITAIMEDSVSAQTDEIAAIMGGERLIPTDDAAFTDLRNLFANAGVDPTSLGE